jgi:SNF2 family DNA or RNA helicase
VFLARLETQLAELHKDHEPIKPPRVHCGDCDATRSEAVNLHIEEMAAGGMGPAATLVLIENLKQITARGKLPAVIEWVEDFLDTGEKLVLFVTHKDIAHTLAARFHAPLIIGDTPLPERQKIVDAFQSDPDVRLVVGNITAMGVGLTLTASSNVAFVELGWNPAAHDQAEDRVHRIGQEDSVTAWYMLGQNTIDERIARLIEQKRKIVNATTDGIVAARQAGESILGDLVAELMDS